MNCRFTWMRQLAAVDDHAFDRLTQLRKDPLDAGIQLLEGVRQGPLGGQQRAAGAHEPAEPGGVAGAVHPEGTVLGAGVAAGRAGWARPRS